MNIWQRPSFVEVCMNAEIGAYQEDTGDERESPPIATDTVEPATLLVAAADGSPAGDTADGL